jgi:predicted AlkP superfamily pyrophosphatase or phosphodiesterase
MNLKKLLLLSFCFLLVNQARSQSISTPARPKLVVGIVIDQMRWDYLYRYADRYGKDGFKRLMDGGFNCQNTLVNYLPSYTAPGHTCIYTGSVPAFHGIVANDWVDIRTGKSWYCTEDTTVKSVGGGKSGLMSPRNLLASTITDELRLATNFRSKTFGVSIKDRGAILPAGHAANGAYWFDDDNGCFITSNYYQSTLPDWVQKFNSRKLADSLMKLDWNTLYDIKTYKESTADNNNYEGLSKGETAPVFPHKTSQETSLSAIRSTPYGNTITRLMAEACIDGEQLGQKGNTDFLAISFSSTDYVGHKYAPNSIEIEDTYLRMDKELSLLLNYLDKKVGKGNYTLFLTADHGGAHNAAFLKDNKIPAESVALSKINKSLNQFLQKKYGDSTIVNSLMNYQVYMNEKVIVANHLDREQVRTDIINWFRIQNGVTQVLDLEHPEKSIVPEPVKSMVTNGYYPNRCGSIQIILNPGWYSGYGNTGTTHGSWNPYDTHIPLIWYGWGISKGETFRTTHMTDISATLAALLHIQVPNACVGEVIEEVRK